MLKRGRPKLPADKCKSVMLYARVSPVEMQAIRKAAESAETTVSEFVAKAVMEKVRNGVL